MNRFSIHLLLFLIICLAMFPASAGGGEIQLNNGDRITGTVVNLEAGKLTFDTDYVGRIQVNWSDVSCLSTDEEIAYRLRDDSVLRGIAECPAQGVLRVREKETGIARSIALSELESVNPPPAVRYRGNLTAGGSVSTGNTEAKAAFGSGRLEVRTEKQRVTLSAKGNYAENDDTLTARNATATAKYDYFLTKRLFTYGQTLVEEDQLQDLNLRTTFGAGLGYQFFDTSRLSLFTEAGFSYVNENYENTDNRSYASGRWSVGFDWQILPDRMTFFHLHEGYVSADDTQDFLIRSEQGFRLPLIDNFYCNIQLDYDYKNQPAPGKKNADLRYLLGLGYEFSN